MTEYICIYNKLNKLSLLKITRKKYDQIISGLVQNSKVTIVLISKGINILLKIKNLTV